MAIISQVFYIPNNNGMVNTHKINNETINIFRNQLLWNQSCYLQKYGI